MPTTRFSNLTVFRGWHLSLHAKQVYQSHCVKCPISLELLPNLRLISSWHLILKDRDTEKMSLLAHNHSAVLMTMIKTTVVYWSQKCWWTTTRKVTDQNVTKVGFWECSGYLKASSDSKQSTILLPMGMKKSQLLSL